MGSDITKQAAMTMPVMIRPRLLFGCDDVFFEIFVDCFFFLPLDGFFLLPIGFIVLPRCDITTRDRLWIHAKNPGLLTMAFNQKHWCNLSFDIAVDSSFAGGRRGESVD